jgi:hypothetical protein
LTTFKHVRYSSTHGTQRRRGGKAKGKKMAHVLHLNKSGSGMASKTACGRNVLRTPFSANWTEYKTDSSFVKCEKCEASKQAEVNRKSDAKKEESDAAKWVPVDDENAWKEADAKLIAAARAKREAETRARNEACRSSTQYDIHGGDRP